MRTGGPGSVRRRGYFLPIRGVQVCPQARLSLLPVGQGARRPIRVPSRCRQKSRSRLWGEFPRLTGRGGCWIGLPRRERGRGVGSDLKCLVLGVGGREGARGATAASAAGGDAAASWAALVVCVTRSRGNRSVGEGRDASGLRARNSRRAVSVSCWASVMRVARADVPRPVGATHRTWRREDASDGIRVRTGLGWCPRSAVGRGG